jgi:hypothetical protein
MICVRWARKNSGRKTRRPYEGIDQVNANELQFLDLIVASRQKNSDQYGAVSAGSENATTLGSQMEDHVI